MASYEALCRMIQAGDVGRVRWRVSAANLEAERLAKPISRSERRPTQEAGAQRSVGGKPGDHPLAGSKARATLWRALCGGPSADRIHHPPSGSLYL